MNRREGVSVSIPCFGIRFSAVLYINNQSFHEKNWIFRELPVAETTAQRWEKRDMNSKAFILKFGRDTLMS